MREPVREVVIGTVGAGYAAYDPADSHSVYSLKGLMLAFGSPTRSFLIKLIKVQMLGA